MIRSPSLNHKFQTFSVFNFIEDFLNLYIIFSKFQCTSHQPISVTDFGGRVNHTNVRYRLVYKNFFNFRFGVRAAGGSSLLRARLSPLKKFLKIKIVLYET